MTNILKAADLHRIVTDALLFASKDKLFPGLCVVQLEASGDHIVATGTDRYTAGFARAGYEGEPFTVLFQRDKLDSVVKLSKTSVREVNGREVTVAVDRDAGSVGFVFSDGASITVPIFTDGEFPNRKRLLPTADNINASKGLIQVGIDPSFMARFDKVSGRGRLHVVLIADNKPVVVSKGDNFVGLIMPVKLNTPDKDVPAVSVLPDWLGVA